MKPQKRVRRKKSLVEFDEDAADDKATKVRGRDKQSKQSVVSNRTGRVLTASKRKQEAIAIHKAIATKEVAKVSGARKQLLAKCELNVDLKPQTNGAGSISRRINKKAVEKQCSKRTRPVKDRPGPEVNFSAASKQTPPKTSQLCRLTLDDPTITCRGDISIACVVLDHCYATEHDVGAERNLQCDKEPMGAKDSGNQPMRGEDIITQPIGGIESRRDVGDFSEQLRNDKGQGKSPIEEKKVKEQYEAILHDEESPGQEYEAILQDEESPGQQSVLSWLGKPVKLTPCQVNPDKKSVLWTVTPVRLLRCGLCTETFDDADKLQEHKDMHIDESAVKRDVVAKLPGVKKKNDKSKLRHTCDVCFKSFYSLRYMKDHRKIHTGECVKCELCGKPFMNKKQLKKHKATHYGIKRYACDVCGKRFVHSSSLPLHKQSHLDIKPFKCNVCHKSFLTKSSLSLHEQRHLGKRHQCEECGKRFSTIWALNYHSKSHKDIKDLQCEICGKVFNYQPILSRHLKTHSEERHQCDLCPRSYKEVRHLVEHTKLHTGIGVFSCETCGKAFTRKRDFKKHIESHMNGRKLGPRIFQCDTCGKQFPSISRLKVHLVTHLDVRPFKCEVCQKSFSQKYYLLKHQRVHTGEKVHQCGLCDRSFTWHSSLKKHLIAHRRRENAEFPQATEQVFPSLCIQVV